MSEVTKDKINWDKAHFGARLSKYSYEKFEENEDLLTPYLKKEGLTLVNLINQKDTGTQCFITKKDDTFYLVFRGTEKDGLDIISDFNAKLKTGDSGSEHSGFKKAFDSVEEEILKNIPDTAKVFVTGHSLGGALATLTFQALKKRNHVMCYTYGAPPVGVNEFQYNREEDEIYRFVNHGDIVPRAMKMGAAVTFLSNLALPLLKTICLKLNFKTAQFEAWGEFLKNFSKDLLAYKHPVSGILLQENGSVSYNSDESLSLSLFFTVLFSNNPKESFYDHAIQKYCDEIEKLIK